MKQKLLHFLRSAGSALLYFLCNLLVIAAVMCALGALFMWLWNMVMPDVFGLPHLNLTQSMAMLVLINVALISAVLSHHSADDR